MKPLIVLYFKYFFRNLLIGGRGRAQGQEGVASVWPGDGDARCQRGPEITAEAGGYR